MTTESTDMKKVTLEEGDKLLREGKHEEALAAFGKCLETMVQEYGQLDRKCARAYYKYGDALLRQVEDQSDVFGSALKQKNGENSEAVDDMEIAWECLETARVALTKITEDAKRPERFLLALVHQRLGDHSTWNGLLDKALEDYSICLRIRESEISDRNDQLLADAHYSLAEAYNRSSELEKSLTHFKLTESILKAQLDKLAGTDQATTNVGDKRKFTTTEKSDDDSNVVRNMKQMLVDIRFKVEEVEEKMREKKTTSDKDNKKTADAAVKPSTSEPQTTIGFGNESAKVAALATKNTNTLSVRRKKQKVVHPGE